MIIVSGLLEQQTALNMGIQNYYTTHGVLYDINSTTYANSKTVVYIK